MIAPIEDVSTTLNIKRAVAAYEPNPNNGIRYKKLEAELARYILRMKGYCHISWYKPTPEDQDLAKITVTPLEDVIGAVVDIADTYITVNFNRETFDKIVQNIDDYRAEFLFWGKPDDPESDITICKIYLTKAVKSDDESSGR